MLSVPDTRFTTTQLTGTDLVWRDREIWILPRRHPSAPQTADQEADADHDGKNAQDAEPNAGFEDRLDCFATSKSE
jgi:hypothetical protein